jgi:hypothetical protein
MKELRPLTKAQETRIWNKVRKEFPADEMMQEIHFIQYKLYHQMKGMSPHERREYFNSVSDRVIGEFHERDDSQKNVTGSGKKRKAG